MSLRDNIATYHTGVYAVTRTARGSVVGGQYVPLAPIDQDVASVNLGANQLELPAHGLATGAGPVWLSSSMTVPAGLPSDGLTPSWVIRVDDDNIRLASTKALALAATPLVIADVGSGTIHVSSTFQLPASVRPIDGSDLKDLPEGQRVEDTSKVFSLYELVAESDVYEADVLVLDNGKRYRLTKLAYYVRNNFWRAFCEKLDVQ